MYLESWCDHFPLSDALWNSALYIYCNRWNAASCRVKENSDEWSHSEPGVSFRMGVEANNGSPNELFYYFLSAAAWVPIRNWIAPNGSNCGTGRALKRERCALESFLGVWKRNWKMGWEQNPPTQKWLSYNRQHPVDQIKEQPRNKFSSFLLLQWVFRRFLLSWLIFFRKQCFHGGKKVFSHDWKTKL